MSIEQNKNISILLVEDNEMNIEAAVFILNRKNYNILVARHGGEALEILAKEKIDLILTDIQMPRINGYEMTKIIRKTDQNIPIIAVTAYALEDDKQKIISAGINDYLVKPYKINELYNIIEKNLKK